MAKKKPQTKQKAKPKAKKDPRIEREYYTEIEFTCPVRGKVKQKVKVKRYRSILKPLDTVPVSINSGEEEIDAADSGMHVFDPDKDE